MQYKNKNKGNSNENEFNNPSSYYEDVDTSLEETDIINSTDKHQTPNKESQKWCSEKGLDSTHAELHDALSFINPELNNDDVSDIRKIIFKQITSTDLKGQRVNIPDKKSERTSSIEFDIQNIDKDVLLDILNNGFEEINAVPKKKDILSSISPTMKKNILALEEKLRTRRIAVLTGPTGVGKTSLSKTLAYHLNKPLYQETPTDTTTLQSLQREIKIRKASGGTEVIMVPAKLLKAAITGAIYEIDEFNYLREDIQLALAQIVDDKLLILPNNVRVPVHPNFAIICTGNIDYGNTNSINDAVLRRAGGAIEISYDPENEEKESIYKDVQSEIKKISNKLKSKIDIELSKEEIFKVVGVFQEIRQKLSDAFQKEFKKLGKNSQSTENLPIMEDFVSYHEQVSFRLISRAIISALLKAFDKNINKIQLQNLINEDLPISFSGKEIIKKIIYNACKKHQFINFQKIKNAENELKPSESKEEASGLQKIYAELQSLQFEALSAFSQKPNTKSTQPKKRTVKTKRDIQKMDRLKLNDKEVNGFDIEIPDFEFFGQEDEIKEKEELINLNKIPKFKKFIKEINDLRISSGRKTKNEVHALKYIAEFEFD